ncbi:Protein ABHD11 [Halotydeus destructor]|nr:Protein ABHD11 [Halotydeus destructor]
MICNVRFSHHLYSTVRGYVSRKFSSSNALDIELPVPVKLSSLTVKGEADLAPVIVCHGLFGNKFNWKGLSRQISERTGRTVHSVDMRNHGESSFSDNGSILAMAADLKKFCDEVGSERSTFIGHSMGGRVVYQFAYLYPDNVEKIVGVDISPLQGLSPSTASGLLQYVNAMQHGIELPDLLNVSTLHAARKKVGQFISSVVPDQFVRDFLLMNLMKDGNGRLSWKFNLDTLRKVLAKNGLNEMHHLPGQKVDCPVLIIYGEKSTFVKASDRKLILDIMPKASLVEVKDASHYLHAEKPAEFVDCVAAFVKE